MLSKGKQAGVTLIELVVGIVIVGFLFMLAAPAFSAWVQNQQIRAAAESILNGIQLARTTAVNNNASAIFVLCNANNAKPTTSWEVLASTPGTAAPAASLACAGTNPGSPAIAGYTRIQERSSQEGSKFAQAAVTPGGAYMITFNSLGRVVALDPINATPPLTSVTVTNPLTTVAANSRPLQINVQPGGNTRMCDPSATLATNDPRHC